MTTDTALLPDILRRRAADEPDRTAYVFLDDTGAESDSLTYAELHARALAVAADLTGRCAPGDRALLIFPQCLDFIVAYFGCLYAGVVAVPVNPPRPTGIQESTRSIVADCDPAAVLTLAVFAEPLRAALGELCAARHWVAVDDRPAVADWDPARPEPDSVAFLQYTSGSTSAPKGVVVTHRNLVANEEMIRVAFGHDRDSTVVGWAPFFHDQGLIGNVLQPLYVGATSVLMSPLTFIRRPLLWPSVISRYRAHTSGGPNFAYDACVARVASAGAADWDLSSWRVAFNGAEPIRAQTLERFAKAFAPYGFDDSALYPCYGLAESTLLVSASAKGRGAITVRADPEALGQRRYVPAEGHGQTLVGSGAILPAERVRVVDPETGLPCPPHHAGEIWVSGDHVAQGYWRKPEITEQTFRARCADDPDRAYLRTGDLGMLVDGELYVVGRLKDMVIVRGRNYYPHDIEFTAQTAHPALRAGGGAAFAVPGRETEKLVVVQEVRRDYDGDGAGIAGDIRAAVLREHDLSIGELVLVPAGALAKTTSGKIMRAAARTRHLADGFEPWTPTPAEPPVPAPAPDTEPRS